MILKKFLLLDLLDVKKHLVHNSWTKEVPNIKVGSDTKHNNKNLIALKNAGCDKRPYSLLYFIFHSTLLAKVKKKQNTSKVLNKTHIFLNFKFIAQPSLSFFKLLMTNVPIIQTTGALTAFHFFYAQKFLFTYLSSSKFYWYLSPHLFTTLSRQ